MRSDPLDISCSALRVIAARERRDSWLLWSKTRRTKWEIEQSCSVPAGLLGSGMCMLFEGLNGKGNNGRQANSPDHAFASAAPAAQRPFLQRTFLPKGSWPPTAVLEDFLEKS